MRCLSFCRLSTHTATVGCLFLLILSNTGSGRSGWLFALVLALFASQLSSSAAHTSPSSCLSIPICREPNWRHLWYLTSPSPKAPGSVLRFSVLSRAAMPASTLVSANLYFSIFLLVPDTNSPFPAFCVPLGRFVGQRAKMLSPFCSVRSSQVWSTRDMAESLVAVYAFDGIL